MSIEEIVAAPRSPIRLPVTEEFVSDRSTVSGQGKKCLQGWERTTQIQSFECRVGGHCRSQLPTPRISNVVICTVHVQAVRAESQSRNQGGITVFTEIAKHLRDQW
eukprot:1867428-Rhodomonas_salina.1